MAEVNNDSMKGIVQRLSSSNDKMSYNRSNTLIGIIADESKQSITKK